MTYPDEVVERVALAIARVGGVEWDYNPEDPDDVYRRDAVAALDALGFHQERDSGPMRPLVRWVAVTDWETE